MKVLKNAFLVVGLLAIAGAVAILVKNAWDLRILYEVAMANKSQPSVVNPTNLVLIGAGVGLLGGVLLGLGIGMPRRTANTVRHETIEELHRQTTADAAVAAAAVTEPAEEPHTEPTA
jgi:NhaP-type Na+/H+ or K+/H+ antiporter